MTLFARVAGTTMKIFWLQQCPLVFTNGLPVDALTIEKHGATGVSLKKQLSVRREFLNLGYDETDSLQRIHRRKSERIAGGKIAGKRILEKRWCKSSLHRYIAGIGRHKIRMDKGGSVHAT